MRYLSFYRRIMSDSSDVAGLPNLKCRASY